MRIKSCPFCGGTPALESQYGKYGFFVFVKCVTCGGSGKAKSLGESRGENWYESSAAKLAIAAWNERCYDDKNSWEV